MVKVTVRYILPWQNFTMGGKCIHSLRYLLNLYSSVSCDSIASAVALRTDNDRVLLGSLPSVKIRNTWQVSTARGQWSADGSPLSSLPCNKVIGVGLEGVIHGDTATLFLVNRKCRDRLSPYRTKCSSSFVPIMLVR